MYMPGRSRTGCRPFRMEMSFAPYATRAIPSCKPVVGVPNTPAWHTKALVTGGVLRGLSVPENGCSTGPSGAGNDHFHRGHRTLAAMLVHACDEVAGSVAKLGR